MLWVMADLYLWLGLCKLCFWTPWPAGSLEGTVGGWGGEREEELPSSFWLLLESLPSQRVALGRSHHQLRPSPRRPLLSAPPALGVEATSCRSPKASFCPHNLQHLRNQLCAESRLFEIPSVVSFF